uniref:Hira domain-containing protein n=1 Tax=Meloidogyne floridensis TaxID=298350 RepID=A0A915NK06_9BILA
PTRVFLNKVFEQNLNKQIINEQQKQVEDEKSKNNLNGINSNASISISSTQQASSVNCLSVESLERNGQVEELTPLPQLKKLNSSAELTPLLRPSDLQNVPSSDSVDMATPQIQKFLCFAVPLSPTCNIDQILVKNSINTKKTLKYAKIQAKFARELRWTQTVASPILLLRANKFWTVCTLEDNNLMIFNTQSGITHLSLHTGATIAFLEIKSDFCLTISINGELSIWDLKKSSRILKTSVGTLLARHEVFLFSRSLNSWLCIIVGQQKCGGGLFDTSLSSLLTAMQFIANSLPNGLISLLIGKLQLITDKNKLPAFELESREEYRFLAALYLQKLVKRGKKEKIADFINDLKTNLSSFILYETILEDIRPFINFNNEKNGETLVKNIFEGEGDINKLRSEKELERSFSWLC